MWCHSLFSFLPPANWSLLLPPLLSSVLLSLTADEVCVCVTRQWSVFDSGMPMTLSARSWVLNSKTVSYSRYWLSGVCSRCRPLHICTFYPTWSQKLDGINEGMPTTKHSHSHSSPAHTSSSTSAVTKTTSAQTISGHLVPPPLQERPSPAHPGRSPHLSQPQPQSSVSGTGMEFWK